MDEDSDRDQPTATYFPAPPSRPNAVTIRLDRYEFVELLGEGGMGRVYKALHTRLKRYDAIKLLPHGLLRDPGAISRFEREVEAAGKVNHPHVVRAYDAGQSGDWHYLVMEYIEGLNLARVVQRQGPMAIADACEVTCQIAEGLQGILEHKLVHRDIKPSNVILSWSGQVKILDLGLALLQRDDAHAEPITDRDEQMGTADYMAPEQASDAHLVDIRADLYSLGCTLYTLLTGQVPFRGPSYRTRMQKLLAHQNAQVPILGDHRSDTPAALQGVLARLMAKSPSDRFARPVQVVEALQELRVGADLIRLAEQARDSAVREVVAATPPGTTNSEAHGESTPSIMAQERGWAVSPATPTRPTASRSRWNRWALVGTSGLVLGLAAFLIPWRGDKVEDRVFTPGVTYKLLDRRPPAPWVRGKTKPYFSMEYFSKEMAVTVKSESMALVPLGTTQADDYDLTVSLQQSPTWEGSAGLYFGGHQDFLETVPCRRFQMIQLQSAGPGEFAVGRFTISVDNNDKSVKGSWGIRVPHPTLDAVRVEVRVRRGAVQSIRWGGIDLVELLDRDNANFYFKKADFKGEFGLYVEDSKCMFIQPTFLIRQR